MIEESFVSDCRRKWWARTTVGTCGWPRDRWRDRGRATMLDDGCAQARNQDNSIEPFPYDLCDRHLRTCSPKYWWFCLLCPEWFPELLIRLVCKVENINLKLMIHWKPRWREGDSLEGESEDLKQFAHDPTSRRRISLLNLTKNMRTLLRWDGILLISTPWYKGKWYELSFKLLFYEIIRKNFKTVKTTRISVIKAYPSIKAL